MQLRVKFLHSDKSRERDLAKAFYDGVRRCGEIAFTEPLSAMPKLDGIDVAVMVGVKSRRLFQRCLEAKVVPVVLDKGYCRSRAAGSRVWEYWRVSIAEHHPTRWLYNGKAKKDRWEKLGLKTEHWRGNGLQIVLAGSSQKYHDFYGLPDPTTWAKQVIAEIRKHSDRPIIYRPKPSWDGAVPIEGTYYSDKNDNINRVLLNSWALVTHGSNACFEAALHGIPSIVLGNAVAKPISSIDLAEIEDPRMEDRGQWLQRLAYWQWTEDEMARGSTWNFIRPMIADILDGKESWPETVNNAEQ